VRTFRLMVLCTAVAATLSSCSFVDRFSPRAVDFNRQAEIAQNSGLLLNIVRASLGRPMQFTTLSTVTGSASSSGSSSLTLPFGPAYHRPKTVGTPDVFGLTGSVSGGPTFTVPVLDTQEFYQGILKPLTGQEYQFFLDQGYTSAMLLYLFVDRIELTVAGQRGAGEEKYSYINYTGDDFDFDRFAAVADYLLGFGLTVEQVKLQREVGPPLTAAGIGTLRDIAAAANAGLQVLPVAQVRREQEEATGTAPRPGAKAPRRRETAGAVRYEATKQVAFYRPCLAAPPDRRTQVDPSLLCGSNAASAVDDPLVRHGGFDATALIQRLAVIRERAIAAARASGRTGIAAQLANLKDPLPGTHLQFRLYMRTTEGIMHYLGAVIRRRLQPQFDRPRTIQVKIGVPYLPYPETPCDDRVNGGKTFDLGDGFRCENLFVVEDKPGVPGPLAVEYDDKTYTIPQSPQIAGWTMRVLDLTKQLLALHTAAKELPASNVLNIIGTP